MGWDPIGDRAARLGRMLRLLALYPGLLGGALLAVHYIIRHLERSIVSLNDLSAALRNSEAQFRELFDNVPIGVFRTSADGRILLVNPAYARMLGFETPDEMRGLDARTLYETASDRESALRAVDRDGEVRNLEIRLRRRDSRVITVLSNVRVMRAAGGDVPVIRAPPPTFPTAGSSRTSCSRHEKWRRWAASPAASRTTSTTC